MRIGPQMARAVDIVRNNPGCTMRFVAARLHWGALSGKDNACGYNPVHRAIDAGLIRHNPKLPHKKGTYALEVCR